MTVPIFRGLVFVALVLSCRPSARPARAVEPAARLPAVRLTVAGADALVEVAATEEDRRLGLMYRRSLAPDSGMLFVFERPETLCFWMQNTWIPLSIAFIDSNRVITNISEMTPEDTTTRYASSRPARFALEMNAGWFQSHGIRPGDTVSGLP